MLKEQYVKSRKVSKVTFALPKAEFPEGIEVESVNLVGDFNNWDHTSTPMEPNSRGTFRATLELEPERAYQFRYLVNGTTGITSGTPMLTSPAGLAKTTVSSTLKLKNKSVFQLMIKAYNKNQLTMNPALIELALWLAQSDNLTLNQWFERSGSEAEVSAYYPRKNGGP